MIEEKIDQKKMIHKSVKYDSPGQCSPERIGLFMMTLTDVPTT